MPSLFAILLTKVKRSQIITLLVASLVCLVIGALAFAVTQHVSIGIGLYWAITTATTVGYGDVTPHNTVGRVIAILVMVTTIPLFGAAFAFLAASLTATRLAKLLHMREGPPKGSFIAIYGMHDAVRKIAAEVAATGERVVVIAESNLESLPATVETIKGDPTLEVVLRRSEPERATRLLIAVEDEKDALLIAVMLRHLAPLVPLIAVANSSRIATALTDLGVETTVSVEDLLGHTLAKSIETPHAGDLLLEMVRSPEMVFREFGASPELIGRTLSQARSLEHGLLLGVVKQGQIHMGVSADPTIEAGDTLLVLRRRIDEHTHERI
ncbi:potassium channel family protein [Ferrimicrobium acidiphilum]|jgi:voltage-gated potassium channel|uniref:pH-gated potassium channel KcsA n=1 Tax=Ferrimicrobium acidiphilum DSM 19497 TaxID=1121877 RepID=A0A0D8FR60_9ACTN|nr:potassium channel protein [Ferrimicrobium acidiphilum]KJE75745.1 pH-gated potassium channel KcsA [Ferrimicrobium acidiphilum DSM 19497]